MPLDVGIDATPLLGVRTGVGRYVNGLLAGLATRGSDDDPQLALSLTAFSLRGRAALRHPMAGEGHRSEVVVRHRPVPARLLQASWQRWAFPPVEVLAGRVDIFHATNFVLPPARHAIGIVTVHDLTFARYPETTTPAVQRYRHLVPRSIQRAALVLCPSRSTADDVTEHFGIAPGRVLVTPLGVDGGWADARPPSPQRRLELGLPERYVVFVGTREPRKNLPMLLDASYRARQQDPGALPLVLAGPAGWGPPERGAAEPTAAGKASDVVVTGFLADHDLRSVVAGAAALVLPSLYEGFGLPILEALACGIPVLAADLPVHREVGGDHVTYLPRDADAWAHALLGISKDAEAGAQVSRPRTAGREWAAGWTWSRCATATAAAYRVAHP